MQGLVRISIQINGKPLDEAFSHVSLRQHVGQHHQFEIRLKRDATRNMLIQTTQDWMGKRVQLGFGYETETNIGVNLLPTQFIGIITGINLSRQSSNAALVLTGQSLTVMADEGAHTYSFDNKSLKEIATQILSPYQSDDKIPVITIEPKLSTEPIPYTVQYKESNFNFMARLAAKYGEWFYYDGLNWFFGKPAPKSKEPILLNCDQADFKYFELQVRAVPTTFKIKGYDYVEHKALEEEAALKISDNPLADLAYQAAQKFLFNTVVPMVLMQRAMSDKELKRLTKRKEDVHISEMVILTGATSNPFLTLGAHIHLKDNTIYEDYGKYIIIALSHDISQGGDYSNHFEAIPVSVVSPPISRSSEPPSASPQAAEVKEINDTEGHGRVKVKFGWQEGTPEISPWIRVASPYTGANKGIYFQPEVGDHVLVAFEQNNPEKPYVLTGMYHGGTKPAIANPQNQFKGIKTRGGNNILMSDKKGSETITITAPHKLILQAGSDILIQTTGKEGVIVINAGETGTINIEQAGMINIIAKEMVNIYSDKDIVTDSDVTSVTTKTLFQIDSKEGSVDISAKNSAIIEAESIAIQGKKSVTVKGSPIKLN